MKLNYKVLGIILLMGQVKKETMWKIGGPQYLFFGA
jgi:hypothetical protein